MSKTTLRKIDLNRFRKSYPYIRRRVDNRYVLEEEMIIETGNITFSEENSKSYTFSSTFPSTPSISAVSVDSESDGSANVNIYIGAISTTSVTFNASANFSGTVSFQAIYIAGTC